MKINIKCEKIELTDAIKNYLEKKVEALEKFIKAEPESVIIDAIIGKTTVHHKKGDYFKAEIKLVAPYKIFLAKAEADDLYAAIDEAQETLKKELIKYKEILIDKHHNKIN